MLEDRPCMECGTAETAVETAAEAAAETAAETAPDEVGVGARPLRMLHQLPDPSQRPVQRADRLDTEPRLHHQVVPAPLGLEGSDGRGGLRARRVH